MKRVKRSLRVLLAGDVPGSGDAIRARLVRLGHAVVGVARTWAEVGRLARELHPDAVLADLSAIDPRDGTAVAETGPLPGPIVGLTAGEAGESTARAAAAGVAAYLDAPVDDRDLDRALVVAAARFADARELAAASVALSDSEERFRRVFEASPAAMALLDPDDVIVRANKALGELLQVPHAELAGMSIVEFSHTEDRQWLRSLAPSLLGDRLPSACDDMRFVDRGGATLWVRASVSGLQSEGGDAGQLLAVFTNITERKELEARLRYLSFHDPLTGLYNRTFFEEELARVGRARRRPVSVLVADLDGLKAINDRLGHAAGDEALRHAAGVLRAAFRLEDVVARIGGDEFAALMVGADAAAAEAALARVDALAQRHRGEGCGCGMGLSAGVATALPGESLLEALHVADVMMYESRSRRRAQEESRD